MDPTLDLDYTIEYQKNICLQNYNFYKFKTELYKLLQKSLFETVIKIVYS